jgi:hypothetical protein
MAVRRDAPHTIYRHASGFSLISLVIGLGIGCLAIELAIQCLSMSQKQWLLTQKSLSFNRNRRSIFLSLRRDLHLAGYRGLRDTDLHYPVAESNELIPSELKKDKEDWRSKILPGSDILTINDVPLGHWSVERQGSDFVSLKKYSHSGLGVSHIKAGQRVLIADARGAEWLKIKTVEKIPQRVVFSEKIGRVYGENTVVTPVEQLYYFVARSDRDSNKRYTLWRKSGQGAEELLQGITAFNVQYRLLKSGVCENDKYWPAEHLTDLSLICGVCVTWVDENHAKPYSIDISLGHGTL